MLHYDFMWYMKAAFMDRSVYQKIAFVWDLGRIQKYSVLHAGLQTPKVFIQTSKGRFVISFPRLSRRRGIIFKSPVSLQHEIDLLRFLKDLPVPQYLSSSKGNYIERLGSNWVTVDRFIAGKSPKRITSKKAFALGQFLGEFHRQGTGFKKSCTVRRRFYDLSPSVMRRMGPAMERLTHPILRRAVDEIRRSVEQTRPPKNLPRGPIHVDIKPENELWIGNRLSGVLDFGNFYRDVLMIDVGKTIMWNCVRNKKLDRQLVTTFFDGYLSRRSVSSEERAYLNSAILFAIYSHIWVDLYHVPLEYVPEAYTLSLVREFLPIARTASVF